MPNLEFWDDEDRALYRIMLPYLLEGVVAGAEGGMELLGVELGIDMALLNTEALVWAKTYVYSRVKDINDVTQEFLQVAVSEWVQSGAPLNDLIAVVTSSELWSTNRSDNIAITEVTRAFAEGNVLAWKKSGVVEGKIWMTSMDELVCPVCEPLDGVVTELSDENGYPISEESSVGLPPAHPRCRCYLHPKVPK